MPPRLPGWPRQPHPRQHSSSGLGGRWMQVHVCRVQGAWCTWCTWCTWQVHRYPHCTTYRPFLPSPSLPVSASGRSWPPHRRFPQAEGPHSLSSYTCVCVCVCIHRQHQHTSTPAPGRGPTASRERRIINHRHHPLPSSMLHSPCCYCSRASPHLGPASLASIQRPASVVQNLSARPASPQSCSYCYMAVVEPHIRALWQKAGPRNSISPDAPLPSPQQRVQNPIDAWG